LKVLRKIFVVLLLLFFSINNINQVYATTTEVVSKSTIFDSEYSFTPKFIQGVTTTKASGMTNYEVDYLRTDGKFANFDSKNWYSARLTNKTNQKGKIWTRYCNVGTYDGKIIDLKITLADWNYTQPANTSASSTIGGVSYPCVMFSKNAIDVNTTVFPAVDSPVWIFTYYINGTEETISIKSHLTFKDMDGNAEGGNEKIIFNSGFYKVYKSSNSYLTLTSNYCANDTENATSDNDQNAWITCLCDGESIQFVYTRYDAIKGNKYYDVTQKAYSNNRGFYHYIVSSDAISPFEFTTPIKEVDVEEIYGTEEFTYQISQFIPGESEKYYYTKYVITDKIADCLEIQKIVISDDTGNDRSSWFKVKQEQTITLTATDTALQSVDFYNNNINVYITVKKKENCDMTQWLDDSKICWNVSNTAQVTIASPTADGNREETLYTNNASVKIYPKDYQKLILPEAGSFGDIPFIIVGTIVIAISIYLYTREVLSKNGKS
jgi:hypothetical protein